MKKVLLIIAIIAIMVCTLAISVSAVNVDGIEYSFSGTSATVTSANQSCELVNVVIPSIVTYENVEYTVTAIADNAFGNATASKANKIVQSVYIPDTVVSIGEHAFREMTSLQSVRISSNVESLINGCFMNSSVVTVTFGEGSKLTYLGEHIFRGCKSLQTINLPNGLTTIDNYVFREAGLTEIVIPNSVTTIGDYAFQSCSNLTSVVLSNNLVSLGSNNFQATKVTEIVFPSSLVTVKNHVFHGSTLAKITIGAKDISSYDKTFLASSNINLVLFAGNETATATLKTFDNLTNVVDVITYEKHLENSKDDSFSGYTNKTIVYGINVCTELNDGVHTFEQINACVERCSVCEINIINHNVEFEYTIIEYENGFVSKGLKSLLCENEGCTYGKTEDAPALFTPGQGYSTQQALGYGIIVNFAVNNDEIKEYEDVTGKKVSYGLFAVLKIKLGEGDAFDESGNAINGTINTDLTRYSFDLIEFKLTGIKETDMETSIAMGAYISVNDGENIVTTCIQAEGGTSNGKYSFISYNQLVEDSSSKA